MPDHSLGSIPHIVLGFYLLLLLTFGLQGYRRRKKEHQDDYYLAGRSQGWLVTSLTIMATFFRMMQLFIPPVFVPCIEHINAFHNTTIIPFTAYKTPLVWRSTQC